MPSGYVDVGWSRRENEVNVSLASSRKIILRHRDEAGLHLIEVNGKRELKLPLRSSLR
jgi:hypothetical protein